MRKRATASTMMVCGLWLAACAGKGTNGPDAAVPEDCDGARPGRTFPFFAVHDFVGCPLAFNFLSRATKERSSRYQRKIKQTRAA